MAQQVAQDEKELAASPVTSSLATYHPTRWGLVNRVLDLTDELTHGHAGWVQRFFSYSFIGGMAAVVNLILFQVMFYVVPLPFDNHIAWQDFVHWFLAFAVAAELSIFANFIPNDYFTFRHLPGHQRSWVARAARFHVTCLAGTTLTGLISGALHFVHVEATLAQAIAIGIAFVFNFTFHHLFTYRHIKQ